MYAVVPFGFAAYSLQNRCCSSVNSATLIYPVDNGSRYGFASSNATPDVVLMATCRQFHHADAAPTGKFP